MKVRESDEVADLRTRLSDAEAAIAAILSGEVDAVAVTDGIAPILLSSAQRALRESEGRYRRIVETTSEGIATIDSGSKITFANHRLAEMLGYTADEMVGMSLLDFVSGDAAESFEALRGMISRDELLTEVNVDLTLNDGSTLPTVFRWSPIHDETAAQVGWLAMVTDISARVESERARQQIEKRFERFVESTTEGIVATDFAGVVTYANRRMAEMVGVPHGTALGYSIFDFLEPAAEAQSRERFERRTKGISESYESRIIRQDGSVFDAHFAASPLMDDKGAFIGSLAIITDVTARKRAEAEMAGALQALAEDREALLRSEKRLRDQFAKLPVATYLLEAAGDDFRLLEFNDCARSAGRHYSEKAVGRLGREVFPELEEVLVQLRRCLRDDVVVNYTTQLPVGRQRVIRTLDLTMGPQQPDRVLLHVVDITERLAMADELRQAQKMEAVGRLAGGIAHDFNNLLTVIGVNSSFLLESMAIDDPKREDVESIHHAGIRASGLTRQLLTFSRKQVLNPVPLDLNTNILEMLKMFDRLLGEDITIVSNLGENLGYVKVDTTQFDQVLLNLVSNARDAMPKGGTLTFTTKNCTITDESLSLQRDVPPGNYVVLDVQDTGSGMEDAVKTRLFEPFFTTKDSGKGTGLGLATVYGIVKQSSGFIAVRSALGRGTIFEIYLPLAVSAMENDTRKVLAKVSSAGMETVLIIEDEAAVRAITKRILKRNGYDVLEADSGQAAVALSKTFAGTIDLVVSDAVMPGMAGGEVVALLQAERPALRALFMSGYTDDEVLRRGIIASTVQFVQKPFTPTEFAAAVRKALDAT